MDATVELRRVVDAMWKAGLEGILIGNAAAALHGAPVSTLDFDFFVRNTSTNARKIREVAKALHGCVVQPFLPVSYLRRIVGSPVEVDMVVSAHGIKSFESLRSRSTSVPIGNGLVLRLADLRDIIRSKKAASRPKDLAVLPTLEATLREKEKG